MSASSNRNDYNTLLTEALLESLRLSQQDEVEGKRLINILSNLSNEVEEHFDFPVLWRVISTDILNAFKDTVDVINNAELNPRSDKFSIKKFNDAFENAAERTESSRNQHIQSLSKIMTILKNESTLPERLLKTYPELKSFTEELMEEINKTLENCKKSNSIDDLLDEIYKIADISLSYSPMLDLKSSIYSEIKKPEYEGKDLETIIRESRNISTGGITEGSLFDTLLNSVSNDQKNATAAQKVKLPSRQVYLNSKVVNVFPGLQDIFLKMSTDGQFTMIADGNDLLTEDGKVPVTIKKAGSKGLTKDPVISFVSLSYTGDIEGKLRNITGYDRCIMNALCGLVEAGYKEFLIEDLWKMLSRKGGSNRSAPTKKQIDKIIKGLEKFAATRIEIDASQEYDAGILMLDDEIVTPIIRAPLLNYKEYILRSKDGKKERRLISLDEKPILLSYSKAKNQILSIPASWLDLNISSTEDAIVLRDIFITGIYKYQNGLGRDNNVFNLDSIFAELGKNPNEMQRSEKKRIVDTAKEILEAIKEKGLIEGYKDEREKSSHKITGIRVLTEKKIKDKKNA